MIIREKAYPRAGLVGNPSDGFFGKTIAFAFTNFHAEVTLWESPEIDLVPSVRDHSHFPNIRGLVEDVELLGYYGGIRLLKAAIKRFYDYCMESGVDLHDGSFTMRYDSTIPHLVGLAGSSAIITACFRALMKFYGVQIDRPHLANLILSAEKDELGISAGLQDRVVQSYQGLVYMDFDREIMQKQGYGRYEELDPAILPSLYIAYRTDLSEGSEVPHNDLTQRFLRKEPEVLEAVKFWAALTDKVRAGLEGGNGVRIADYLNQNFDRRAKLYAISEGNMSMIQLAREAGASAKFTGSGGAIVGTYDGDSMFEELKMRLEPTGVKVIKPVVAPRVGTDDGGQ